MISVGLSLCSNVHTPVAWPQLTPLGHSSNLVCIITEHTQLIFYTNQKQNNLGGGTSSI